MKKIFISGPYTKGDVAVNVKNAMDLANQLIELNFAPFCPHLTHFLHMNHPQTYSKWLEIDSQFLLVCDAVLRMPGESNGADLEVKLAISMDIPVFFSINELLIGLKKLE